MKFNWKNLRYSSLRLAGMLAIGGAVILSSCSGERSKVEYGEDQYSNDAPEANTTAGRASNSSTAGSTTGAATTSSTTGAAAPGGSSARLNSEVEGYDPEYGTTTGIADSPVGRGGGVQGSSQGGSGSGDMSESDTMSADKTTSATGAAGTGTGSTTGQGSGKGTSRTATTGSAGEGTGGTGSGTGISTEAHQRERAAETNRPQSDSTQNRRP